MKVTLRGMAPCVFVPFLHFVPVTSRLLLLDLGISSPYPAWKSGLRKFFIVRENIYWNIWTIVRNSSSGKAAFILIPLLEFDPKILVHKLAVKDPKVLLNSTELILRQNFLVRKYFISLSLQLCENTRHTGTSKTFKCGLRLGPTTVLNFNSDSRAPSNTSASLCPYKHK